MEDAQGIGVAEAGASKSSIGLVDYDGQSHRITLVTRHSDSLRDNIVRAGTVIKMGNVTAILDTGCRWQLFAAKSNENLSMRRNSYYFKIKRWFVYSAAVERVY